MRNQFLSILALSLSFFFFGGQLAHAQGPSVYRICIVQVRDAGDPMVDLYDGVPAHWYFSAVFASDVDESQKFLLWAQSHYGRAWTINHSESSKGAMFNKGLISTCKAYASLEEAQKALGSPRSDGYQNAVNAYFTHTDWPNVPPDSTKKH
jgi:hypothetical protein